MKIVHITTEPPMPGKYTGGMGVHIWNITKEQTALGHEVTCYCAIKSEESHGGVCFRPWEYHVPKFEHECAFQIEAARRTTRKLYQELIFDPPDIIHCHEWDAAPVALDLGIYLATPVVSTLHLSNTLNSAHMTAHHTEVNSYYLWWEQEMMRRSNAMIAISEHYRKWIQLFNQGRPVYRIHNGINIDDFTNGITIQKPDDRILAFFHGRLCGQKGLDIIAQAAKQSKHIYWVIAGPMAAKEDGRCLEDGVYSDLLQLEREGKVKLLGMVSQAEVGAWLRACDVAVYPHKSAPFDCAVLEAMACGAAVITTGIDAISEYAEHNKTALFCEANAPSLLASIKEIYTNFDLAESIRVAAKKHAQTFTWQEATRKTLEVYNEVLHGDKNHTSSERAYQ